MSQPPGAQLNVGYWEPHRNLCKSVKSVARADLVGGCSFRLRGDSFGVSQDVMSALGGGQVVSDQRFDGATGYVLDSFNGNREITGSQLDTLRNGSFPTPLLNYRDSGAAVALADREKVGAGDAYVIQLTPKAGPVVRLFIDTGSFMLVKSAVKVDVPQLGGEIEQVVEFSDFRDVDGIKVPYAVRSTNPAQTIVATTATVTHNAEIDDSSFSRPAGQ